MLDAWKGFILYWGALGVFWSLAVYFSFMGSQAFKVLTFKKSLKHLLFGLPVFALFYFCIKAFGVPEYIVYDHVAPKKFQQTLVYPAVKIHPVFQSTRYQRFGVISQDLTTFTNDEKLFDKFGAKKIPYRSLTPLKRYTNELCLLGLFLFWLLFNNRLHNTLSSYDIFKKAVEKPSIAAYQDYLSASQPVRFLQPLKRKKAKKSIDKISKFYDQLIVSFLQKLYQNSPQNIYLYMTEYFEKNSNPALQFDVSTTYVGTKQDEVSLNKKSTYTTDVLLPDTKLLSEIFSKSIIKTLNACLPEPFVNYSTQSNALKVSCPLKYRYHGLVNEVDSPETKYVLASFDSNDDKTTSQRTFLGFKNIKNILNKSVRTPKEVSTLMAKQLTKGFVNTTPATEKDAATLQAEFSQKSQIDQKITILGHQLAQLNAEPGNQHKAQIDKLNLELKNAVEFKLQTASKISETLLEKFLAESKNVAKDLAIDACIKKVIEQNQGAVDAAIAEVYSLVAEHSDVIVEFVATETINGLIELAAGGE